MASVLHRGHSFQADLVTAVVPIMDVCLELDLELIERAEPAAAEELVLHVPEEPLHAGVVQAGGLARHALGDAQPLEPALVAQLLVLPSLDAPLSVKSNLRVRTAFL